MIESPCEELAVELDASNLVVTLDRPKSLNALNAALLRGLGELVTAAAKEPAVSVVVLTGSGDRAFSAGADIKEWMANKAFADIEEFISLGHHVFNAFEECKKPIVCAVNGVTLGGGFELALACDVRIAVDSALFAFPEPTLGAFPGWGGLRRLASIVGVGRAKEIAMTTRQVHADEALALGLVSRVCERGELLGAARQVSEQMRRVGPIALAQVKRLTSLYASTSNALISQYLEVFGNAMLAGTSDFQEGEHAFLEKRPPRFTGH